MAVGLRFCPKCGSIMYPHREGGKQVFKCRSCGHVVEVEGSAGYRFTSKIEHKPAEKIIVVKEGEEARGAQVLKGVVSCPKCGHDEVIFWMMQTRSADEPMTRFYRCVRCKHTWREYA